MIGHVIVAGFVKLLRAVAGFQDVIRNPIFTSSFSSLVSYPVKHGNPILGF